MIRYSPSQPGSRPFYVTDDVIVTESWLIVGKRRLSIRELRNPQIVQAPASRLPVALAIAAMLFPPVGWVAGFTGVTAWTALLLGTALGVVAAAVLHRTEARPMVLQAEYLGVTAPVFWSTDERVFGQVTRAVLRAHETVARRSAGLAESASGSPE